ncbi:double-strand break repair protein AddB [Sphingomonas naphthae]|uniref:Double-strand break repair protein AddB n=1 Tax=Sphingomonas naphthae TaxID=1813468 RepID=A0ABY7TP27_9SPHN|nr:double-strand break repair protein AddB [Sphingomonas naphthae]WCT74833.1 double-strand break repair protein AddB [Sphingomonas naphthae]
MSRPSVFSIPLHRSFADALAAGLLRWTKEEPLGLAQTLLLVPGNRAGLAIRDAFVRRAEGGLLLPRIVAIGDPELDEKLGAALDPIDDGAPIPPAIDPLDRRLILARLLTESRVGDPIETVEAMRLAGDLGRVIDQMLIEGIDPAALADVVPADLARHWESSLAVLRLVLDRWPEELRARGLIDLADRRGRLLARADARWRSAPPAGRVVAAGISGGGAAVAALLRTVSRLERGAVVLAGVDLDMPQEEWDSLGPTDGQRAEETHPQYHLKRLLDAMDVGRGEVEGWRYGGGRDAPAVRTRAISNALAPAAFTAKWQTLPVAERRLTGVKSAVFATPAEEAQAIAVALREAVQTEGRTAALVTPDRMLARRVSAHLRRWGIEADDSAGRALSSTPPATLLLALAEAAAEGFAPVALMTLLKHPLVNGGGERLPWLEKVRRLDRALRGPRPAAGLGAITAHLEQGRREKAIEDWAAIRPLLEPLEAAFVDGPPSALVAALREAVARLAGDAAWGRPAGRATAALVASLEEALPLGPRHVRADAFPAVLKLLLDEISVRPPQGGHPRISIWGLIEARLQQPDLTILGGLNEGVWPSRPAPDPWLAPAIRAALGLPGIERRIGIQAHDLATALGGREVLVTRARRDARAPAIASRFWLRMEAMTSGLTLAPQFARLAEALDRPKDFRPAGRPAPSPPVEDRPRRIAVTRLDRLKADPFAFYASQMLRLSEWDAIDADPTPAWRGSQVHKVIEEWLTEDDCRPDELRARAERMLANVARHPVLHAMWTPRLLEAIERLGGFVADNRGAGRVPLVAERKGRIEIEGVTLEGTADRIDRLPTGGLAIVDYKTGQPPSGKAVIEGYSMQLGLLGLIADRGGFEGIEGKAGEFEYWSLAADRKSGDLGYVQSAVGLKRDGSGIEPGDFTDVAARNLIAAVQTWLLGEEPFTAKLHPDYSPYEDYDQLMRLDEWYGARDL